RPTALRRSRTATVPASLLLSSWRQQNIRAHTSRRSQQSSPNSDPVHNGKRVQIGRAFFYEATRKLIGLLCLFAIRITHAVLRCIREVSRRRPLRQSKMSCLLEIASGALSERHPNRKPSPYSHKTSLQTTRY